MDTKRKQWHGEMLFYCAAIGSSIGIGNVWKFPALTWKHGGPAFVIGYLIIMLVVGVPMLVLEITLGQKT
jgi:NSS family neurotransmitter:Na+ symporter